jgi:hypothetical protein
MVEATSLANGAVDWLREKLRKNELLHANFRMQSCTIDDKYISYKSQYQAATRTSALPKLPPLSTRINASGLRRSTGPIRPTTRAAKMELLNAIQN